ncbi:MAG: amino acid adenylation domain-containing protein [Actinomycetota bacterium]|nr:amino acid adenylation domain-containing protein [Actinomycetota bacterium]
MADTPDLADLVERTVAASPAAVAVVTGPASLTYAQLDKAADRLARRLRDEGVGPEVLVGLCVERSLAMAVGVLAILKAGGACLPLDPAYPPGRVAFMLEDADPLVVLTQRDFVDLIRAGATQARIIEVDPDGAAADAGPISDDALRRQVAPEGLAYVLYTSGSTGEPRGVLLTHGNLVNHCLAAVDLYELGPEDRVLQFCSPSFDVSIEEMFPTWAAGGRVVLRPPQLPILGRAWLDWLTAGGLTVLNLPTAYWQEWTRDLETMAEKVPGALRTVIVGGERAVASSYRAWLRVGGDGVRWFNAYGPTEASVMATIHQAPSGPADPEDDGDPPIGRPLANVTVHVLGPDGQPVTPGESGEIHIGGAGVARGYLNHPELSAERFVVDPFSADPGARLYCTGDLGRVRPDGELDFVGRLDRQVKVRGFRIECGEVELALRSNPAVADVVVTVKDRAGDRVLVAYVIFGAGVDLSPSASAGLRDHLAARLPAHMVPSHFVVLDAFPLSANGKVDHEALPLPAGDRPTLRHPAVPPRSPVETAVAGVWSEVLGIDDLGVDDDLFDLGGHSLQAVQILARVEDMFSTPVPLGGFLDEPTIAALNRLLEAEGVRDATQTPSPKAERRRPGARIPLSLPQEQMWTLEAGTGAVANENVTASHRFAKLVDPATLRSALRRVVARHESLRTGFGLDDGLPYQHVEAAVQVDVNVAGVRGSSPAERERDLAEQIGDQDLERFDPGRPPLLRAKLFQLPDGSGVMAVTFDHLICDGPSAYIFLSELVATYEALAADTAPALRPLIVQYPDFALWQRRWLTEERLNDQLEYWRGALAGMPLGPSVPFDRVPDAPSRRLASQPVTIGPSTYRSLARLARRRQASVFMACVAVVSALLALNSGADDVVLSTTLSGRRRSELEGVIGNFATTGRLRTDLSGDPSFGDALDRARASVVGLLDHQDIPFFRVRAAVLPELVRQQGPGPARPPLTRLPTDFQYFRTAADRWAPGTSVVERAGGEGPDQMFFRGQLHPLSVSLFDDGTQLWGNLVYKLDFYDAATIEGLAAGLEELAEAVAGSPDLPLSGWRRPALDAGDR